MSNSRPNLVFVFSDQHRAEAAGYAGNKEVRTPHLDVLANESIVFSNAVSGHPACCPYRASLFTGRYPQTHGVFVNDVCLGGQAVSIADAFKKAGYETAYIGKWHLDGHGRSSFIPRERRQGVERKQYPYDESILVPFLLYYPGGCSGITIDTSF